MVNRILLTIIWLAVAACSSETSTESGEPTLDIVLAGGTIYDGNDSEPVVGDVGIIADRIVAVGDLSGRKISRTLDVSGLAVAPGFIDIHNHAVREDPTRGGIFM